VTEDELNNVRNNLTEASDKKFYNQLKDKIYQKIDVKKGHSYLPSKGLDSGKMFVKHISTKDDIPESIIQFFEKLT
jgi:hypothetical protein